jgi:hypothetical protein
MDILTGCTLIYRSDALNLQAETTTVPRCRSERVAMIMFNKSTFTSTYAYFMTWSDGRKCVDWTAAEGDSVRLIVYVRYPRTRD